MAAVDRKRAAATARAAGLELREEPGGLALTDGRMALAGDLTRLRGRIRPGNLQRELLVKAARVRGAGGAPTAVDATAGLGEDALLLAAAGFEVLLFERDAAIAALLEDALARARRAPETAEAASRMELRPEDSLPALPHLDFRPDVVLLDPMFPAKRGDARAKKKLQMLQRLEAPCTDERALLDAAFAARPRKVVVKRPLRGPQLAGRAPSYSLRGKTVRYDVHVLP